MFAVFLAGAGGSGVGCHLTVLAHSMEKEMAIHSSILAWKIPWTEEPGGL